jgi:hypothetical protein
MNPTTIHDSQLMTSSPTRRGRLNLPVSGCASGSPGTSRDG